MKPELRKMIYAYKGLEIWLFIPIGVHDGYKWYGMIRRDSKCIHALKHNRKTTRALLQEATHYIDNLKVEDVEEVHHATD